MSAPPTYSREDLSKLKPRHGSFVGIDSDGCVFPTMEIKQKQCFHKLIVSHWHLEDIEATVRETAEFVNLYSAWRGTNRFIALVKTFDLLRGRPAAQRSAAAVPELRALRGFIRSGAPLGNPALAEAARQSGDTELASVLRWSEDVNEAIARTVRNVPPFKWVAESLEQIRRQSDAICVSQTPTEALVREWEEHGLVAYVSAIAGQELGTKAEHIALAAGGKYPPDRILMVGDARGDRQAAEANGALFFPVNPGEEEVSWKRFCGEAYRRFLAGTYRGAYQDALVAEFEALLPETPTWRT
jgi:phosphoglycolate phosphatase-like HAD superfamily hydrolase